MKRTRGELNDVVKRRNSEISVEKGKEDKFIKTQHKRIFQASNQKSDVGVGTLSLLTGLSYLNAVQAFKKSSKGTTFGELFRSEAVLALVASVVSLFIVFIL